MTGSGRTTRPAKGHLTLNRWLPGKANRDSHALEAGNLVGVARFKRVIRWEERHP